MAKIAVIDEKGWNDWVATRPPEVQELCRRLPPDRLYRMKSTGQRVTLLSYSENGTVRVSVSGDYNFVTFERQVFGVNADDLEECDLPGPSELTGALLTEPEVIDEFIDSQRDALRRSGGRS
jgi:hypothetical protein